jgi:hypothetical protein
MFAFGPSLDVPSFLKGRKSMKSEELYRLTVRDKYGALQETYATGTEEIARIDAAGVTSVRGQKTWTCTISGPDGFSATYKRGVEVKP